MNAADAATVDELATPHLLGCFTEKLKLTGAYRSVRKHPMCMAPCCRARVRSNGSTSRPEQRLERACAACGHDVMLDMPERTAELLASMA